MIRDNGVTTSRADSVTTERHQLVTDNIPLVHHLVREVSARIPASVDRDDLRSAGLAALVAASHGYDASRGVPFTPYAATRIRGAILDELRSTDWATRSVRRRGREIDETRQRLASSRGSFPDDATVADTLGISTAEVTKADAEVRRASLVALDADHSFAELLATDSPSPQEVLERNERLTVLSDAIAELPDRLRMVVRGYFLEERPMAELGAELGVTESRISQLRAEALVLLREALDAALEQDTRSEPDGIAARRRRKYAEAVVTRHAARYQRQEPVAQNV